MSESRFRFALVGSSAIVVLNSCTIVDPGPPPEHWAVNRSLSGGVYRLAYFTDAQVRDRRWEARRLAQIRETSGCSAIHVVRRDVQWYPATEQSRRRCAALVYAFRCTAEESVNPRLNQDRIEALRSTFGLPIEAECGEKESSRRPQPPRPPSYYQPIEELLSGAAACGPESSDNGRRIRVGRRTRVYVKTLLHPALANAEGLGRLWYLVRIPEGGIGSAMYRANLVLPNFERAPIPNDGANLLVLQEFAPNPHGGGYCVRLTARQGGRVWQRRIERPEFVEHLRRSVGVDVNGLSRDPSRFWSPQTDARALAAALGAHVARNTDRNWYPPL